VNISVRKNIISREVLTIDVLLDRVTAASASYGKAKAMQFQGESNPSPSARMIVPYYIGEAKSDMRSIKHGWYAIEDNGKLASGPFSSREECVKRMTQPTNGTAASE
jgi:hypothetical protein